MMMFYVNNDHEQIKKLEKVEIYNYFTILFLRYLFKIYVAYVPKAFMKNDTPHSLKLVQ